MLQNVVFILNNDIQKVTWMTHIYIFIYKLYIYASATYSGLSS